MTTFRQRLYRHLDPKARDRPGLSPLNRTIALLIVASVLFAIVDSEPQVIAGRETLFILTEYAFGSIFLLEYLARVWVSVEDPSYAKQPRPRLRYLRSPAAIVDLLALSPLFFHVVGAEAYVLRLLRLLRLVRLARFGRFSTALTALRDAIASRRYELIASVWISVLLLLVSSTLMYMVEGHVQPEKFGSIPRAMWWSIATLTTVGYGDVVPLTAAGKIIAGFTAIAGIGLIAMPTGILAAALSDAMQRHRSRQHATHGDGNHHIHNEDR